ncbi:hypothetical protein SASPL_100711 [Salvia splendens]|uniref:Uncharacterized protein n=1 Tax=Salvia splendens TaxID=180675 RepID=A0A8X8YMW7_SALSN|nr:hypothetical protein SASPL_100711 [Salvia splendens]
MRIFKPANLRQDMQANTNASLNPVSHLTQEFEERSRAFSDAVAEVESDQAPAHTIEEFRRLRDRFEAWKKDYKARLKEAKVKVYKLGRIEAEKHRMKWGEILWVARARELSVLMVIGSFWKRLWFDEFTYYSPMWIPDYTVKSVSIIRLFWFDAWIPLLSFINFNFYVDMDITSWGGSLSVSIRWQFWYHAWFPLVMLSYGAIQVGSSYLLMGLNSFSLEVRSVLV